MADVPRTRMTAAAFLALPETDERTELLDGEAIVAPAPGLDHQRLVLRLAKLIEGLAAGGEVLVAPVDVLLDEHNVVQPDVLWRAANGPCQPVEGRYLKGAPDLVIEIVSPTSEVRDRGLKFDLYEQHAVREYWIVELEPRFIEVYVLAEGRLRRQGLFPPEAQFNSPVLGGQTVSVSACFGEAE